MMSEFEKPRITSRGKLYEAMKKLSDDSKELKYAVERLSDKEISDIPSEAALEIVQLSRNVVDDLIYATNLRLQSDVTVAGRVELERELKLLRLVGERLDALEGEIKMYLEKESVPNKLAAKAVAAGFTLLGIASIFVGEVIISPIALILEGLAVLLAC